MRVAVIGSGLGGLSAACTLAARGYEVEVFEKNPWLGGKAAVLQQDGFASTWGQRFSSCRPYSSACFAKPVVTCMIISTCGVSTRSGAASLKMAVSLI